MNAREPLSAQELEAALRHVGATRYHNLHPFHNRLHSGQCTFEEVQAWALNRYYYQAMIPVKDATVLSRMHSSADRREWRKRIEDHDGTRDGEGGIRSEEHTSELQSRENLVCRLLLEKKKKKKK